MIGAACTIHQSPFDMSTARERRRVCAAEREAAAALSQSRSSGKDVEVVWDGTYLNEYVPSPRPKYVECYFDAAHTQTGIGRLLTGEGGSCARLT